MRIKICGIAGAGTLDWIVPMQPDFLGFIFYPRSPRYMIGTLEPSKVRSVPRTIVTTGVFVNETAETISDRVEQYRLRAVQLHGDQRPGDVDTLRNKLAEEVRLIKAFGIDSSFDWDLLKDYQDSADFFLFDTKSANYGGTGISFDPVLLQRYEGDVPYFIAGGLGPGNLSDVLKIKDERLYAADLNSKLETRPGEKDRDLVRKAMALIRKPE